MSYRGGFTLIELSIVLVTIGLIIGGVLVGRDLIQTSRYRATVKEIEQFNSAVNAFKLKYNCLPGDFANATELGFVYSSLCGPGSNGTAPNGNGDGIIDLDANAWISENCYFFDLLSQAGLIASNPPPMPIDVYVNGNYPTLNGWWINYAPGLVMYQYDSNGLTDALSPYFYSIMQGYYGDWARAMQPAPAFYIDTKLDDGLPLSGQVRAFDSNIYPYGWYLSGSVATGNPANGPVCLDNTQTPVQYSITSSAFLCGLAIKANF